MLQVGRFAVRGAGAVLVCGPVGMCLVEPDLADAAADIVWGREDIGRWLSQMMQSGRDLVLFDLSGSQPYLTALGDAMVQGRRVGSDDLMAWRAPIWAWPVNPVEWRVLEASVGQRSDEPQGTAWRVAAHDRMEAGWVRIGRGLDETECVPEVPRPEAHSPSVSAPVLPERRAFPIALEEEAASHVPIPTLTQVGGVERVEEAEAAPADGGFLWAPDPPAAEPEPFLVQEVSMPEEEPPPLVPAASAVLVEEFVPPVASTLDTPVNPEAFEETMTPQMLERMRSVKDAEATILRRAEGSAPAGPTAFLLYGGTAPTEVTRDVVIGRDPDARAISGRPAATTLRVLSPATEISRSHCAVMATAPGVWSLMDVGSANGTLVRHADGAFEEVPPMVMVPLTDGDLIDVGEGTTIEFRIR
nr:FHA domain-containing protein [Schaalia hyovaginalis]